MEEITKVGYDDVVEALYTCHGLKGSAITWLRIHKGIKTNRSMINKIIDDWNLKEWVEETRINAAENCLTKMISKGIDEGEFKSLAWMLSKYGQHIEFLSEREESSEYGISDEVEKRFTDVMDSFQRNRQRG